MGERVKVRHGEVWLDDETGIVHVTTLPNSTISLEDAKEEIAVIAQVSGGKRRPLFIDMRSVFIDMDAREYYGSDERAAWRAVALLTTTPQTGAISKMWAAAYDHEDAPSRVYFAEKDAIEWLQEFVEK